MAQIVQLLLVGLGAGVLSGLIGVGGGIVIIPALVGLLGMSQHHAQGTSLALMVPPIGILAAWTYYKHGYVDLKVAAFICLGFVLGSVAGSKFAVALPTVALRRVFGGVLFIMSLRMIFGR